MEIQTTNISISTAGALPLGQAKSSSKESTGKSAELADDFGVFQKRVLEINEDPAKVEAARQALLNGELDSETSLLSAAENILNLGL